MGTSPNRTMMVFSAIFILFCCLLTVPAYRVTEKLQFPFYQHTIRQRKDRFSLNAAGNVPIVPYHPQLGGPHMWMDLYNVLGRKRKLFVSRYLDQEACNVLVASLLWLDNQKNEKITLYLNVPGGAIQPALGIYDTISRLASPVEIINTGLTVGVGCLLAAAGTPGMRYAFPNSRFLMGKAGLDDGIEGQSVEIALEIEQVVKGNRRFLKALSKHTQQLVDKLDQDFKRDFYLTAPEAVLYGLIDTVLKPEQVSKRLYFGNFCSHFRVAN